MSKVSKEDLKKLQELAGIYTDTLNEKDAGDSIAKTLKELPDSDFPNWWQSKITKAGVYISDAKHYLENTQAVPPGDDMTGDGSQGTSKVIDPDFERDDVQDPSGVS
jgi:hypothetical protein